MSDRQRGARRRALVLATGVLLLIGAAPVMAQSPGSKENKESKPNIGLTTKLRIQVTGGDKNEPVGSASVYVRYQVERALRHAKKIEMNLKTNLDGGVKVPEIPRGRILVQVIAPGWKTFGQYYDLEKSEETIQIKLAKPPRWY